MIRLYLRMRVERMRNEKGKGIFKAIQIPLSLTLLLTLLLASGLALTQASATATANVSIGDLSCVPGATVTAPILITNVENYGTGTINLEYNSSVVHVIDVTNEPDSTVTAWTVDNTSGIVNISAWNLAGVSGNITFANVTFKAVGSAGSTPLNLSVSTLQKLPDYVDIPVIIKNGSFTILPPTPFFIYGYVVYENDSECHNPTVNVTNRNASNVWNAETKGGYNYYQLMLSHGIDINASEVLQFNVTSPDGSQSNITEHTVIQDEINNGGLFNFNITLRALAVHDINVSTGYSGAVNGIKIIKDGETIPAGQDLIIGEDYTIRSRIANEGDFNETVNVTIKVTNGTGITVFQKSFTKAVDVGGYKDAYRTWDTSGLVLGNYNIMVNASIPVDTHPDDNERTRGVTLKSPTAPHIISFAPHTSVTNNESESRTFNITIDQTVNISWLINGSEVSTNTSVTATSYTNESAVAGYWNVSAYVYNENGSDMQTWWWTVIEDCDAKDGCYAYGNGCEDRDYYWSEGSCVYTHSNRHTDYYDGWINYCKEDEVWKHRLFHDFYCDGGTCTDHTSWKNDTLVDDCNNYDGWVDTGNTTWITNPDNECKEKEQKEQEYRDYSCSGGSCDYSITETKWIDTGNTRNKTDGTICGCTANNTLKKCYAGGCSDTGICNSTYCDADPACDGKKPGEVCGIDSKCNSNCNCVKIITFDTGAPANPYPSIFGTHNGTITPYVTIYNISKLYTYSCPGTGGHSEYVAFYYPDGTEIANASWTGYAGDWHNISFDAPFTLEADVTYIYTIKTGSYPQIIHKQKLETEEGEGEITCLQFKDVNGKIYYDWIPAIKLIF